MRIVFYKLPAEGQGENILITESYAYVDSEIAVMLDDADLDLSFFDIYCDEGRITVHLVKGIDNVAPYLIINSENDFEATLPFKDENKAYQFAENIMKWQAFLMKAYDE